MISSVFIRRILHAALFLLTAVSLSRSAGTDSLLTGQLQTLLENFPGTAGLYVHHFERDFDFGWRADSLFPTASMIKVPILAALFAKIDSGEPDYNREMTYRDSLRYPGADILGSFRNGETIVLSRLVMLMITTSDNTAALWNQRLAGGGTAINAWLEKAGFTATRVNSRTAGRQKAREEYGWGQSTPREMARLLTMIRNGKVAGPAASEEMYRVLCNIYWNGTALSQIPPYVQAASKQGAVSDARSEVVLVNAPSGDYVFCVMTRDQRDTGWSHDNEGFGLIRHISRLLWNYFEPDHPWRPAPGRERYVK